MGDDTQNPRDYPDLGDVTIPGNRIHVSGVKIKTMRSGIVTVTDCRIVFYCGACGHRWEGNARVCQKCGAERRPGVIDSDH